MADFEYTLLKGVPCIEVVVEGRNFKFSGRFILDTGAFMTIVRTPRIDALGYSARDATKPFITESVIGKEKGYCLRVAALETLGKHLSDFEVAALDLPLRYNVDGLIGMNFLGQFNWCFVPGKSVISVS